MQIEREKGLAFKPTSTMQKDLLCFLLYLGTNKSKQMTLALHNLTKKNHQVRLNFFSQRPEKQAIVFSDNRPIVCFLTMNNAACFTGHAGIALLCWSTFEVQLTVEFQINVLSLGLHVTCFHPYLLL